MQGMDEFLRDTGGMGVRARAGGQQQDRGHETVLSKEKRDGERTVCLIINRVNRYNLNQINRFNK